MKFLTPTAIEHDSIFAQPSLQALAACLATSASPRHLLVGVHPRHEAVAGAPDPTIEALNPAANPTVPVLATLENQLGVRVTTVRRERYLAELGERVPVALAAELEAAPKGTVPLLHLDLSQGARSIRPVAVSYLPAGVEDSGPERWTS